MENGRIYRYTWRYMYIYIYMYSCVSSIFLDSTLTTRFKIVWEMRKLQNNITWTTIHPYHDLGVCDSSYQTTNANRCLGLSIFRQGTVQYGTSDSITCMRGPQGHTLLSQQVKTCKHWGKEVKTRSATRAFLWSPVVVESLRANVLVVLFTQN